MNAPDSKEIVDLVNLVLENMPLDERTIFARTGDAVVEADAQFLPMSRMDIVELGRITYEVVAAELQTVLCVKESGVPKPFVKELLEGELRNLAIGMLSAVTSTYHIAVGILVPVIALILKSGVKGFCEDALKSRTTRTFRGRELVPVKLLTRR